MIIGTIFHDADALLYRNACAAVKTHYRTMYKNKDLGKVFEKKADYNKFVKEQPEDQQPYYSAEPVEEDRGAQAAYTSIDKKIYAVRKKLGATKQRFYLTDDDKSNFRYDLASIIPYKGNRNQEKPKYYYHCMEYLIDHWNAEIVYGEEADDRVAQEQWIHYNRLKSGDYTDEDITCIAHIDKDINMVPGYHISYTDMKLYWVSELEGLRNFYTQLLTGDKQTDNIPGLYQLTGKQARAPLKAPLEEMTTAEEMYSYVRSVYAKHLPAEITKVIDGEPELVKTNVDDILLETGNLLYMRKERGVWWDLPNDLTV